MQGQYAALNEHAEEDDEVHHISFAPSHDGGCGVREPAPIAFLSIFPKICSEYFLVMLHLVSKRKQIAIHVCFTPCRK